VSELDEAWALALAEAQRKAHSAGHADIAAYLRLRSSNDLLRKTGIEWLLSTFTKLAGKANREGGSIQISEQDAHRFPVGNATMVGRLLTLSVGVRKLSIEAGWPRQPSDGFVRGNGLACGSIRHFGKASANEELLLVRSEKDSPRWVAIEKSLQRRELLEAGIRNHLARLLSGNYR